MKIIIDYEEKELIKVSIKKYSNFVIKSRVWVCYDFLVVKKILEILLIFYVEWELRKIGKIIRYNIERYKLMSG